MQVRPLPLPLIGKSRLNRLREPSDQHVAVAPTAERHFRKVTVRSSNLRCGSKMVGLILGIALGGYLRQINATHHSCASNANGKAQKLKPFGLRVRISPRARLAASAIDESDNPASNRTRHACGHGEFDATALLQWEVGHALVPQSGRGACLRNRMLKVRVLSSALLIRMVVAVQP